MTHPAPRRLRRLAPLLGVLLALASGAPAAAHGDGATHGDGAPAAGVTAARTQGLRVATGGTCAGGYVIVSTGFCSHGPDTRPAGRRLTITPRSIAAVIEGPLPDAVLCDGDGTTGKRVQAIYARLAGTPSRRDTVLPQIRTAAAGVQSAFLASAARTDGVRRPRWVTDAGCRLAIAQVTLSDAARTSLGKTITELQALGYDRADRKYLIWWDTNVYCGIGTFWGDDTAAATNLSNTHTGYARVDAGCWGWAESHELMHTLGAVQNTAPHSTYGVEPGAFAHCTDEWDIMCYPDAPNMDVHMQTLCPDRGLDGQFDCGNDDYFDTDPEPSSYLADHWNTADSGWLERTVVELATPVPSLATGRPIAAGRVPVTAVVAARAPLAGLESVRAQRRAGEGSWTAVATPDGAAIVTTLPLGTATTFRVRTVDATGTPSPWLAGPAVVARLWDDTDSRLTWARRWTLPDAPDALGGAIHRSRRDGATVTLRTTAAELGIVAGRGPLAGRLEIRVDGVRRRIVDLRASSASIGSIVATVPLGPGRHTVELRVRAPRNATPGWRVDLDAIALLER